MDKEKLEKLFSKLEPSIMTESVKTAIVELLDEAVQQIEKKYADEYDQLAEDVSIANDTAYKELLESQKDLVVDQEKIVESTKILESHKEYIKKFNIDPEKESETQKELDTLKESYNTLVEENKTILKESEKTKREIAVEKATTGMTVEQKKDFTLISESIEFGEDFDEKIKKLKELSGKQPTTERKKRERIK